MRVAHITWLLSSDGGGIPPVVFALANEHRAQGATVRVFGVCAGSPTVNDVFEEFTIRGPRNVGFAPGMLGGVEAFAPDVVHLHGLFTWPSHVTRVLARRGTPAIVTPHGMLEPWALSRSAWKKRLFRWFVEDENLGRAACLHALNKAEAQHFRSLGFSNRIAIVPNGVNAPDDVPPRAEFDAIVPGARGRRVLLFLARIHPKKGLPHLIDAWAMLRSERAPETSSWFLCVAGPDQLGHAEEVSRRIRDRGLQADVAMVGPLYGRAKSAAFAAADGFILPSFSEGFSVAVLEAMAHGVPVLVTHQCNIDVESLGAGLLAEPTVPSIAQQLRTFLELPDPTRMEMGQTAARVVRERFTWRSVARELLDVYRSVISRDGRPASIEVA